MMVQLTPLQSRIAAVILLLTVTSSLITAIALPTWRLHQRYDLAIEDFSDRLQRYRSVAALRPGIEEATREVEQRNARRNYLQAQSGTLASAELQRLVTQIIDKHKGRITSSQVLPLKEDAKKGPATRMSVSVQLNASVVPLQLILHALETSEPYLFVDQLTVRASQGRNYKVIPGTQPEFAVQLNVSAYVQLPEGGSK